MKVRPFFYAALYGGFWLAVPSAFFGKNLWPLAIAVAAMMLATAFAARRNRHAF